MALPIRTQISAGGVVVRAGNGGPVVALICVGEQRRWQLPKGWVEQGESPAVAALREVREEAGVEAEVVALLDTIEYWFVATDAGERVRIHKRVHFFHMRYTGGDVANHDHEVVDARWIAIGEARGLLAFENERAVLARVAEVLGAAEH